MRGLGFDLGNHKPFGTCPTRNAVANLGGLRPMNAFPYAARDEALTVPEAELCAPPPKRHRCQVPGPGRALSSTDDHDTAPPVPPDDSKLPFTTQPRDSSSVKTPKGLRDRVYPGFVQPAL